MRCVRTWRAWHLLVSLSCLDYPVLSVILFLSSLASELHPLFSLFGDWPPALSCAGCHSVRGDCTPRPRPHSSFTPETMWGLDCDAAEHGRLWPCALWKGSLPVASRGRPARGGMGRVLLRPTVMWCHGSEADQRQQVGPGAERLGLGHPIP